MVDGSRPENTGRRTQADPIDVLCVDDDQQQIDVLALYLDDDQTPFRLTTTTDAREALEIATRDRIDCVVSDFDMPRMTGLELLEALREERPEVPFILHTSFERHALPADIDSFQRVRHSRKAFESGHFEALADSIEDLVRSGADR